MEVIVQGVVRMKEKFLNMDILTKRTFYRCEDNYVTLAGIKNWTEYVRDNNLKSPIPEELDEKLLDVDEELNSKVSLWQGDITRLEIDVIVNSANTSLLGGVGVAGCIHDAAGPYLREECITLGGCEQGSAKITGGYELPAKYVIHAVGPHGKHAPVLRSAYEASLNLMIQHRLRSIAFPCISTGIKGYPVEDAAHVALLTVRRFLQHHKPQVDRVIFTVFSEADRKIYEEYIFSYFPVK